MKRELIIFDLDGTLIDSRIDIANSVNFALERLKLRRKSFDAIVNYIGGGVDQLLLGALGAEWRDKFGPMRSLFLEHHTLHFLDNTVLYPHVKETIFFFKERDKKMAVLSNKLSVFSRRIVEAFGLSDCFELILGGEDTLCRKPLSCPVDIILRKTGAGRDGSLIVGDMDIDIETGRAAGIMSCAVTYGIGRREDILKAGPDLIIGDIAELMDIIE